MLGEIMCQILKVLTGIRQGEITWSRVNEKKCALYGWAWSSLFERCQSKICVRLHRFYAWRSVHTALGMLLTLWTGAPSLWKDWENTPSDVTRLILACRNGKCRIRCFQTWAPLHLFWVFLLKPSHSGDKVLKCNSHSAFLCALCACRLSCTCC